MQWVKDKLSITYSLAFSYFDDEGDLFGDFFDDDDDSDDDNDEKMIKPLRNKDNSFS